MERATPSTPMPVRQILALLNKTFIDEGGTVSPYQIATPNGSKDPDPRALFHIYPDDSDLVAEETIDGFWLLHLYREAIHDGDSFEGDSVESVWEEAPNVLVARCSPGIVTVRYGNDTFQLRLDD